MSLCHDTFLLVSKYSGKQLRAKECIDTNWGFLHYLRGCLKGWILCMLKFDSSRDTSIYAWFLVCFPLYFFSATLSFSFPMFPNILSVFCLWVSFFFFFSTRMDFNFLSFFFLFFLITFTFPSPFLFLFLLVLPAFVRVHPYPQFSVVTQK